MPIIVKIRTRNEAEISTAILVAISTTKKTDPKTAVESSGTKSGAIQLRVTQAIAAPMSAKTTHMLGVGVMNLPATTHTQIPAVTGGRRPESLRSNLLRTACVMILA